MVLTYIEHTLIAVNYHDLSDRVKLTWILTNEEFGCNHYHRCILRSFREAINKKQNRSCPGWSPRLILLFEAFGYGCATNDYS